MANFIDTTDFVDPRRAPKNYFAVKKVLQEEGGVYLSFDPKSKAVHLPAVLAKQGHVFLQDGPWLELSQWGVVDESWVIEWNSILKVSSPSELEDRESTQEVYETHARLHQVHIRRNHKLLVYEGDSQPSPEPRLAPQLVCIRGG